MSGSPFKTSSLGVSICERDGYGQYSQKEFSVLLADIGNAWGRRLYVAFLLMGGNNTSFLDVQSVPPQHLYPRPCQTKNNDKLNTAYQLKVMQQCDRTNQQSLPLCIDYADRRYWALMILEPGFGFRAIYTSTIALHSINS